jgi:hypothetical protein
MLLRAHPADKIPDKGLRTRHPITRERARHLIHQSDGSLDNYALLAAVAVGYLLVSTGIALVSDHVVTMVAGTLAALSAIALVSLVQAARHTTRARAIVDSAIGNGPLEPRERAALVTAAMQQAQAGMTWATTTSLGRDPHFATVCRLLVSEQDSTTDHDRLYEALVTVFENPELALATSALLGSQVTLPSQSLTTTARLIAECDGDTESVTLAAQFTLNLLANRQPLRVISNSARSARWPRIAGIDDYLDHALSLLATLLDPDHVTLAHPASPSETPPSV